MNVAQDYDRFLERYVGMYYAELVGTVDSVAPAIFLDNGSGEWARDDKYEGRIEDKDYSIKLTQFPENRVVLEIFDLNPVSEGEYFLEGSSIWFDLLAKICDNKSLVVKNYTKPCKAEPLFKLSV